MFLFTSLFWIDEFMIFFLSVVKWCNEKLMFIKHYSVCLLFGVYRPSREFFTHMETSQFSVKGCKFWHMLSILAFHTYCCTGIRLQWSPPRTCDNHTYWVFEQWSCHYLFSWLGYVAASIRTPNFLLAGLML